MFEDAQDDDLIDADTKALIPVDNPVLADENPPFDKLKVLPIFTYHND